MLHDFALYCVHQSLNSDDDRPLYGGLHHCGIIVRNATSSKSFYTEVFGFTDESHLRPATLPYPGAFLCCGGSTQIHLMVRFYWTDLFL